MLTDHNEIIRGRYQKVEALRSAGHNPYPNRYAPTASTADVRARQAELIESGEVLSLAGRVMTLRTMGKAAFFHLQDSGGQLQVYLRRDDVPAEQYEVFKQYLDLGDIVGVTGFAFLTKTGELSLHAQSFELLTKAVRPLPEKWHGLTDKETRYRQRYVDLIANLDVRETFIARSRIVQELRSFLVGEGYLEVETPMMHPLAGGAAARPFTTHHNALDMPLFLRIAPELYLKRLTVGGLEKTFEINRNFRNEGLSPRHNPEFTMLELYTAYWNYLPTMELTERAIRTVAQRVFGTSVFTWGETTIDLAAPFRRITYLEAIVEAVPELASAGLSWTAEPGATRAALRAARVHVPEGMNETWRLLTHAFEERAEPLLQHPTFITEFPKAASPLAKSKADEPAVAERFELYVCGMELANGYSELNDPREQFERFQEQVAAKAAGDAEANDMDEDYIRALEYGMPPTSGLGVGIDRLSMVLTGSASIRDVILFPLMKPIQPQQSLAHAAAEEVPGAIEKA